MRLWSGVVVALAAGAPSAATQQILAVDLDAGREIVGGFEYAFSYGTAVVDYGRRLVLVSESADPLAVMAYSLDDGSVQGVFGGGPAGDGPGELTVMLETAVGPEGVLVSGPVRVLYWSWSGALLHQWRPTTPPYPSTLCALDGRPAVALQKGLVFRGDDGESVALGGEAGTRLEATPNSRYDADLSYGATRMACADSAAYVLDGTSHVLMEYKMGAEPRLVAMPAELVEVARKRLESSYEEVSDQGHRSFFFREAYSDMFLADDGRLVITTRTHTGGLAGAVVDRATGCYALLEERTDPFGLDYVGMFGDSVVTLESSRQPTTIVVDGKPRRTLTSEQSYIFVRPVRPASGEPCS